MARTRLDWIDAARGFAMALVVLLHVTNLLKVAEFPVSSHLRDVNAVLDGFRMPTLLMVSGVLATSVKTWSIREVIRRRVAPLLLAYVIWGLIVIFALTVISDTWGVHRALTEVMLLPLRPFVRTWYLLGLALFILAAWCLRRVPSIVLIPVAMGLSLYAYAVWPTDHSAWHMSYWLFAAQHWVFFVCAERWAGAYTSIAAKSTPKRAAIAAGLFLALGIVLRQVGLLQAGGDPRSALPALALAVLGTIAALFVFPVVAHARSLGWARAVGRNSLGVYVNHYWIAAAIVVITTPFILKVDLPGAGSFIPVAIVVVAITLALALAKALKRWVPVPLLRPWWDSAARPQLGERKAAPAPAQ